MEKSRRKRNERKMKGKIKKGKLGDSE